MNSFNPRGFRLFLTDFGFESKEQGRKKTKREGSVRNRKTRKRRDTQGWHVKS